jgi:hypothetical protein
MTSILVHLSQVSIFGPSALALLLILGLDWAFSALHSYEEWKGEDVPLWRVFGAIVGLWVPHWLGFVLFTLVLTLILWAVALAGIAGWLPVVGEVSLPRAVGALGALVGARIGDTLISHWSLYALGYRPNPGLRSTPLYIIEAIFILVTFWKGLSIYPVAAWTGFLLGAGGFALVLPLLRALRVIVPSWRRDPWIREEPIPSWATG